jgi:hypothetical protein
VSRYTWPSGRIIRGTGGVSIWNARHHMIWVQTVGLFLRMWAPVRTTAGGGLPPRSNHTAVQYQQTVYVFGGDDVADRVTSDLYACDLGDAGKPVSSAARTWVKVATKGPTPAPRSGHTAVVVGDCTSLFLFSIP